ncbi:hypothetical protein EXIGLDRAFT_718862 [Exidia glandulosa HHB12029]|uniref:Uncharacterized protein n=1 Tax=Exidia glandulosa HHB12029 TaxID=1314781 RepID=A0A165HDW6_EXIGL|nr:hypothetical protein EXIGLDRAFT_718857 [Exidia glandulosa HHB12029]KZV91831.1 hypothetical protein EXIGLDRAFT_718862 [Exidia glandulosa HHB12029]
MSSSTDSSSSAIYRRPNIDDFATAWADSSALAGTGYWQKAVQVASQERVFRREG